MGVEGGEVCEQADVSEHSLKCTPVPCTLLKVGIGFQEFTRHCSSSHAQDFTVHHHASLAVYTLTKTKSSPPSPSLPSTPLPSLLPLPHLILLHSSAGSCSSLTVHDGFLFRSPSFPSPPPAACASACASCCRAAMVCSKPYRVVST